MDAFDLMTSLSATFPTYILRALSADYIKKFVLVLYPTLTGNPLQ